MLCWCCICICSCTNKCTLYILLCTLYIKLILNSLAVVVVIAITILFYYYFTVCNFNISESRLLLSRSWPNSCSTLRFQHIICVFLLFNLSKLISLASSHQAPSLAGNVCTPHLKNGQDSNSQTQQCRPARNTDPNSLCAGNAAPLTFHIAPVLSAKHFVTHLQEIVNICSAVFTLH